MSKKEVVFEPFKEDMILDVFDEDYTCPSSAFDIDDMEADQLDVAQDMREDDLADIDKEIEKALNMLKNTLNDVDSLRIRRELKINRQRRQQIVVELRTIKNRIKMMNNIMMQEAAVA